MKDFFLQRRNIKGQWIDVSVISCHQGDVSKVIAYLTGNNPDARLKSTIMNSRQLADTGLPVKTFREGCPECSA